MMHSESDDLPNKLKYLIGMVGNLDFAPFMRQMTLCIYHERTALNAANLFAVHHFLFDDIELCTEQLVGIANQFKRQFKFCFEPIV